MGGNGDLENTMGTISRRDFLRFLGAGAFGLFVRPKLSLGSTGKTQASDVVQCFDENATSGATINVSVVQTMVDESIKTLTGIENVGEAWKSIFPGINDTSVIGVKVNCINNAVPTNPELVDCILAGLAQMEFGGVGYSKNNVIIWDRTDGELSSAGYSIYDGGDPDTARCFGTNHSGVGYDTDVSLDLPGTPSSTNPSSILSTMCDHLINVAVLKNHGTARVTLTMKNNYGSVSPVPSHNSQCDPYIPALNKQIRDSIGSGNRQRIFIIDALWGSVTQGPGGSPNVNPNKVIMSLDMVACDSHGQAVINEERQALGQSAVSATHISTAAEPEYDLGTAEVNLIEISNPARVQESEVISSPEKLSMAISPNPFRGRTTIALAIAHSSPVRLDLLDRAGRVQARIYDGQLSEGTHRIGYVDHGLPSGTYFVSVSSRDGRATQKVTLLK